MKKHQRNGYDEKSSKLISFMQSLTVTKKPRRLFKKYFKYAKRQYCQNNIRFTELKNTRRNTHEIQKLFFLQLETLENPIFIGKSFILPKKELKLAKRFFQAKNFFKIKGCPLTESNFFSKNNSHSAEKQ